MRPRLAPGHALVRALLRALALGLLLSGGAGVARADQQRDPELRSIVERAIAEAECFPDEYEAHIQEKRCPTAVCEALVHYFIVEDKCIGCGVCYDVCKFSAVTVK